MLRWKQTFQNTHLAIAAVLGLRFASKSQGWTVEVG